MRNIDGLPENFDFINKRTRPTNAADVVHNNYAHQPPRVQEHQNDRTNINNDAYCARPQKAVVPRPVRDCQKRHGHYNGIFALEDYEVVRRKTKRISLSTFVVFSICIMIIFAIVNSAAMVNNEVKRYNELSSTLESLRLENQQITNALAEKHGALDIGEIAVCDLGMVKHDNFSGTYISLSEGNCVTVYPEEKENEWFGLVLLNTFGNKIGDFLEFLD